MGLRRKPAVSCVMAVYNPEDFEFIIVVDGSEGKIFIFSILHFILPGVLNFFSKKRVPVAI
jgi:hypothetical protein